MLDYIRSSVEIIMNLRQDAEDSKGKSGDSISQHSVEGQEPPRDYEAMLQKLEAEVRSHVRLEQQLKLHIDSMQNRDDDLRSQIELSSAHNKELLGVP